jgi:ABC-type enterobactin transport system permease subunit
VLAIVMMAVSLTVIIVYGGGGWVLPAIVGGVMAAVAVYLVTRPTA